MTHPKIERDIPIPNPRTQRGTYPFPDMEVGESVFFPREEDWGRQPPAASAAYKYGQRHGKFFIAREEEDGVRIWRVEGTDRTRGSTFPLLRTEGTPPPRKRGEVYSAQGKRILTPPPREE